MQNKPASVMFMFCLMTSFALAQGDKATAALNNDATQARLRLGHFVYSGPNVDLYVDGKVATNGGQQQVDIPIGYVNGYLYLEPGSHNVAVVPTGEELDHALLGPLDLPLKAGHRYTLAMMGQMEDESLKPLVIDETAELEKVGATQGSHMVINNVAGTRTIDFDAYGSGPHDVPYGGFGIKVVGAGFAITVDDDPNAFIEGPFPDGPSPEPGTNFLSGFMGRYPGTLGAGIDLGESAPTSDLDLITFLQTSASLETFMAAVETAGLTELLSSGGPYLLLAPTNEAFEALPKDQLDALMADPKALANLLRNHIIEEYVPRGSLAETPGGPFNRTFTNLLGMTIKIGDEFTINGTYEGDTDSVFVTNGTQVHPIMNVMLQPE